MLPYNILQIQINLLHLTINFFMHLKYYLILVELRFLHHEIAKLRNLVILPLELCRQAGTNVEALKGGASFGRTDAN